jgi:hypothetical protein
MQITNMNVAKHSNTGWATVKVLIKEISTVSQSNNGYPIRALCLGKSLQFPSELKCKSINALIVSEPSRFELPSTLPTTSTLSISFLEKFPNLKIVRLSNTIIDENIAPVLSKISLLKVISLKYCEIDYDCFSRILGTCATLEDIELAYNSDVTSIILPPPQVKRLHIMDFRDVKINLSRCTQLQSL